ncbi:MAG: hypothetical protein AAF525_15170 [Pseudomonadota bacterium]
MSRLAILLVLLCVNPVVAEMNTKAEAVGKAVLAQIKRITYKYPDVQRLLDEGDLDLDAPEAREDAEGKFVLPFDRYGGLTEWAEDALSTKDVGITRSGSGAVGISHPLGHVTLRDGLSKSMSDIELIGGWERIRETSHYSLDDLASYSLLLHDHYYGTDEYKKVLAAAIVIYPKLERTHRKTIEKAYRSLQKEHLR